jgi:hypothetical protein
MGTLGLGCLRSEGIPLTRYLEYLIFRPRLTMIAIRGEAVAEETHYAPAFCIPPDYPFLIVPSPLAPSVPLPVVPVVSGMLAPIPLL